LKRSANDPDDEAEPGVSAFPDEPRRLLDDEHPDVTTEIARRAAPILDVRL
jgi:hypothetical protein